MKHLRNTLLIISTLIFIPGNALAATYYVDPNVSNGDGSSANPYNNVNQGIARMSASGGDTLILRNGTYDKANDDMNSFVSGTAGNYNIIKAENDGGAIFDFGNGQNDYLRINNESYLQIEGIKFIFEGATIVPDQSVGLGGGSHHIKILKSAFEGGAASGNETIFVIGGNSSYVLIEDSWFYGSGGRINLSIYGSNKVIIRRVVIRHDHGWSNTGKTDPEGSGTIYNSNDVELQNVIILDGAENPSNGGSEWVGAFTLANNTAANATCRDNYIRGTIALNVEGNAFDHGGYGNIENINFQDVVVWWSNGGTNAGGGGAFAHSNGSFKSTYARNMTIGNQGYAAAIWGGVNSIIDIKDSIIYNVDFATSSGNGGTVTDSYNNCYNTGATNCSSTGTTTYNPTTNGLLYPPRIEDGSNLITAGEGGGRVGANITNKIGVSGTLWGDTGYNTVTTDALWPWPYEARIHDDFSGARNLPASSPANRGFAASGQTLTNHIWEALGNNVPGNIGSVIIPVPQNVTITKNN